MFASEFTPLGRSRRGIKRANGGKMDKTESVVLHVEIVQTDHSAMDRDRIAEAVDEFLTRQDEIILGKMYCDPILPDHVSSFRICSDSVRQSRLRLSDVSADVRFYVYRNSSVGPESDGCGGTSDVPKYSIWTVPNANFEGLWESLVLDGDLKSELISYVQTTMLYSRNLVSSQIVRWNGVVLLHGPPGSGKTSLCKALAHKLSIRMQDRYASAQIFELACEGMLSKWFSESSRAIVEAFRNIEKWLENEDMFACILVDEVESLVPDREEANALFESVRVVNCVLKELDRLQSHPNVVVLATSNIPNVIDAAFVDRIDLKLFIGYPAREAAHEILRSCVEELVRRGVVSVRGGGCGGGEGFERNPDNAKALAEAALASAGLSGRALRKIPFLTSARLIDTPGPSVETFLRTMKLVAVDYKRSDGKLRNGVVVAAVDDRRSDGKLRNGVVVASDVEFAE